MQQLLRTLVQQGASDLHISAGSPPRLRIDGQVAPLNLPPMTPQKTMELCYSVLTEAQKKTFEQRKELDLSFSIPGIARFRANIFYQSGQISGAFRVIPHKINTLDELGSPPLLKNLCALPRGLVLVTGPTGSGKSTTLAAMLNHINETRYDHIVTIEDPIEFVHQHKNCVVDQRELGEDTQSFSMALKSVLRQDPDVILIGEMRDPETISAALTIAETGHLVFGTLHTNGAVSSINRMVDSFPPHQQSQVRTQLAMSLEAVLSQMLLPRDTGGRVMCMEIMRMNSAIRALVQEGKVQQIYSSMQTGQAGSGMQTMNQCLYALIQKRLISKEIALQKSPIPDELQDMLSENKQRSIRR
ncbi:type IV pilus twitching motility protein PilT [Oligoflexus tunisiensis]|uniref:type IV pilus twitching motility protein PilT n=1 Tax=Oligoflexus tunisiensis TaxID=708132 RepID=UPI001C405997|nr:type IV pilus twitching motility protein PilT [Oligoflexus tunisiensis]